MLWNLKSHSSIRTGTNALLYEYYKQAREMIPSDIGKKLHATFNSHDFQIVNTR